MDILNQLQDDEKEALGKIIASKIDKALQPVFAELVRYKFVTGKEYPMPDEFFAPKRESVNVVNEPNVEYFRAVPVSKRTIRWKNLVNDSFETAKKPITTRDIFNSNLSIIEESGQLDNAIKTISATLTDKAVRGEIIKIRLKGIPGIFNVLPEWVDGDQLVLDFNPDGVYIEEFVEKRELKKKDGEPS